MKNSIENFGDKEPRPDIQGLLSGLREYNGYFNWGGVVARGIMPNIEDEASNPDNISEEERQKVKFEELKKKYENVL